MHVAALFVALAAGATPEESPPPEEDISLIDKPELSRMELEAGRLEHQVTKRVPNTPVLAIARGDTVFIEIEIPLLRAPEGVVEARPGEVRSPREVRLAPRLEPSRSAERAQAWMSYAVRVAANTPLGSHKLNAVITASDRAGMIGTKSIAHTIEVSEATTAPDVIALDRRAYLYHQTLTLEAYKSLPELHDYLRYDRVDAPPPSSRVKEADREALDTFHEHRLRADIAHERLRAAAQLPDLALAEKAIVAIGGLSRRPTGPAARASVIDGVKATPALAVATAALDDLRIDVAEGIANKLRNRGDLTPEELARTIDLLAAIYSARGREDDAREAHGRALCIMPKLDLGLKQPALAALVKRTFEKERVSHGACTKPLAVSTISAVRTPGSQGVEIVVKAMFGPDPRQLIAGGDIEIWGGGGGRTTAEKIRALHDGSGMGALEARFPDTGQLENYTGQLLIKVLVRDVSGVVLADAGDPDPLAVAIATAPDMSGLNLPWWAYALAAGVAVAGALTALGVVAANRDTQHGIGPIVAEF